MTIEQDVRGFEVGTFIELFEVDTLGLGAGIFYFTNMSYLNGGMIEFNGQSYTHLAVAMDSLALEGRGKFPRPIFKMATAGGPVAGLLANNNDLIGSQITRIRTLAKYLDLLEDGITANGGADGTAHMPKEVFFIDHKIANNHKGVEWTLTSAIDQEGIKLPYRVMKKRYCDLIYRFNNGDGTFTLTGRSWPCPWVGTVGDGPFFDENNQPTTAPNDRCAKTLPACLIRFGRAVELPFGGFPGLRGLEDITR